MPVRCCACAASECVSVYEYEVRACACAHCSRLTLDTYMYVCVCPSATQGVLHPVVMTALVANGGAALHASLRGLDYTMAQKVYYSKVQFLTSQLHMAS